MALLFNNTDATLNNLVDVFQNIAENHAQINSFGFGEVWNIASQTVTNYPLLWAQLLSNKLGNNTITYKVRVFFMDLVTTDLTNETEVKSNAIQILNGIYYLLRDYYDLEPLFDVNVTPFQEKFNDRVAGAYADIDIEVPNTFGWCDEPMRDCLSGSTFIPFPVQQGGCGGCIDVFNTDSISWTGSGSTCQPLGANINVSEQPENTLVILPDGLYSSGGTGVPSIPATQIAFGDANNKLTSSSGLTYASGQFNLIGGANFFSSDDEGNGYNVSFTNTDINFQSFAGEMVFTAPQIVFNGETETVFNSGLNLFNSGEVQINDLSSSGTTMVVASSTGVLSTQPLPVATTPGGSNTQIQYNNNGAFGGSPNLTWGTNGLTVLNPVMINTQTDFGYNLNVSGTTYISTYLKVGSDTVNDGTPFAISDYGNTIVVPTFDFSEGFQEYAFVLADVNFAGWEGVQSAAYVQGNLGAQTRQGKFTNYLAGFASYMTWDGNQGSGNHQLANFMGYFSAVNTQSGGIANAYDLYASEINTTNSTTENPPVVNHYNFYAEPNTYATNNYGIYINGTQKNYFGGNVTIAPLASSGTTMVVATSTGLLSTQSIPVSSISSVSNSDGTLTISPTTGAVVASLALGHANTWTGAATFNDNGLGSTTANMVSLTNTTAAISGTTQVSPALLFQGSGFGTSGAAAQTVAFQQYVQPVQGLNPIGNWILSQSINGAAETAVLTVASNALAMTVNSAGLSWGNVFTLSNTAGTHLQGLSTNRTALPQPSIQLANTSGYVSIGTASDAIGTRLQIGASTATMSQINLIAGVDKTTPVNGDIWYDGTYINFVATSGITTSYAQILKNNLGSTIGSGLTGLYLTNTTPATSGQTQYAPALTFSGQGWSTTNAASQTVQAQIGLEALTSTNPASAGLYFSFSLNGGAWNTGFAFSPTATNWSFNPAGLWINPVGGGGISLTSAAVAAGKFQMGNSFIFQPLVLNGAGQYSMQFTGSMSSAVTSGNLDHCQYPFTFAPTSGSGTFNLLNLSPTINQTGGASGTTRAIYINPTLTAAANFHALEIALGKAIFAASTASSTSINIPAGTAPTSPNVGDLWVSGGHFYICLTAGSGTLIV
jgi:hypothetical protein